MAVAGSLQPVAVDTVLLVEPKKPASLHVISGTMQMFLDVLPLDRGVLNDTVRVRVPGTGRILLGRVVAAGRLEAQF
jgi:flagella basal body P-ring formation protein FlgA